jgi:hypothetical protein
MKQWLLIILYMLLIALLMGQVINYARTHPLTEAEIR